MQGGAEGFQVLGELLIPGALSVVAAVVLEGLVQVFAVFGAEVVGGNLDLLVSAGDEEGVKPGFRFPGEIPLHEGGLGREEAAQVRELGGDLLGEGKVGVVEFLEQVLELLVSGLELLADEGFG
ncbi:hypothetical protein APPUASWS_027945 [Arthrospira platensis str. Paraca]|nr:hypothetical protein APPUASWS_027945 [Arthrospira platensis str. Paraca]